MDGWMDGWKLDGKAGLRIAYSNQKTFLTLKDKTLGLTAKGSWALAMMVYELNHMEQFELDFGFVGQLTAKFDFTNDIACWNNIISETDVD